MDLDKFRFNGFWFNQIISVQVFESLFEMNINMMLSLRSETLQFVALAHELHSFDVKQGRFALETTKKSALSELEIGSLLTARAVWLLR